MARPDFGLFLHGLLDRGIAAGRARRVTRELEDHFDDLCRERMAHGYSQPEAETWAADRLGDPALIREDLAGRRELKGWAYRHPRFALLVLPAAWLMLQPAVPLVRGAVYAQSAARWLACSAAAALITAAMMLVLQVTITAG